MEGYKDRESGEHAEDLPNPEIRVRGGSAAIKVWRGLFLGSPHGLCFRLVHVLRGCGHCEKS